MITRIVRCADCRTELPERENVARDHRSPCPTCGSLNRMLEIETQGHILRGEPMRASDRARRRPPDSEPVKVTRRFDLDRGTYWESVERELDGIVIRHVEQPLQEHISALASADSEEATPRKQAD
jgi:hypothetical protein